LARVGSAVASLKESLLLKKSALVFLVAALCATSVSAASAAGKKVVVPGGTPVTFEVNDTVSSATAQVGDTFQINAAQEVVIDGWIVIAKGAGGQGEVVKVDPAGSHGHAGSLGVQLDWVYAVDGNKIRLTAQPKNQQGQGSSGAASTTTIASYVLLGPLGLFAHNFVKGHDVELNEQNTTAHPLSAYIDSSVYVVAQQKAMTAPGFAPAAPEATSQPVPPRL
jgi:hypothetical protein